MGARVDWLNYFAMLLEIERECRKRLPTNPQSFPPLHRLLPSSFLPVKQQLRPPPASCSAHW